MSLHVCICINRLWCDHDCLPPVSCWHLNTKICLGKSIKAGFWAAATKTPQTQPIAACSLTSHHYKQPLSRFNTRLLPFTHVLACTDLFFRVLSPHATGLSRPQRGQRCRSRCETPHAVARIKKKKTDAGYVERQAVSLWTSIPSALPCS